MSNTKQRHGCLTAYLIFALIMNLVTVFRFFSVSLHSGQNLQQLPTWAFPAQNPLPFWASLLAATSVVFHLVCLIALFRWRKWGFYGILMSFVLNFTLLAVFANIIIPVMGAVFGSLGVATLYGVLQIGGDKSGWTQLE